MRFVWECSVSGQILNRKYNQRRKFIESFIALCKKLSFYMTRLLSKTHFIPFHILPDSFRERFLECREHHGSWIVLSAKHSGSDWAQIHTIRRFKETIQCFSRQTCVKADNVCKDQCSRATRYHKFSSKPILKLLRSQMSFILSSLIHFHERCMNSPYDLKAFSSISAHL